MEKKIAASGRSAFASKSHARKSASACRAAGERPAPSPNDSSIFGTTASARSEWVSVSMRLKDARSCFGVALASAMMRSKRKGGAESTWMRSKSGLPGSVERLFACATMPSGGSTTWGRRSPLAKSFHSYFADQPGTGKVPRWLGRRGTAPEGNEAMWPWASATVQVFQVEGSFETARPTSSTDFARSSSSSTSNDFSTPSTFQRMATSGEPGGNSSGCRSL